jgi:hypothetical protein
MQFVDQRLLTAALPKGAAMRREMIVAIIVVLLGAPLRDGNTFPLSGDQTVLPPGTELNEEALDKPRELFRSEAQGGAKSYMVNLGDLTFNSNLILGGPARRAGMSCGTCHVNGAGNGKLYIPGMSTRPGNFDTTGPLFNPRAHNRARDPVRIPSLRGARFLAPTRASQKAADLAPVRFSSPNGGILETKELNLSRLHSGPYFMRYSSMALLALSGPDTTSVPSGANQRKQVIPLSSNSITYSRSFMRLTPSFSFDRIFTIAGERRARFEKVVHRANRNNS